MLVKLTRREIGKVTGDLFKVITGLAATEKARRRVVNKVMGNMCVSRPETPLISLLYTISRQ